MLLLSRARQAGIDFTISIVVNFVFVMTLLDAT